MTYPVSQSAAVLSRDFPETDRRIRRLRNMASTLYTASLSGDVNRNDVVGFRAECIAAAAAIVKYSEHGQRGLDYATDQLGVTVVADDYSAVSAGATQMAEWIRINIPDGSAKDTWDQASGSYTPAVFTTAQLDQLRAHINTFLTLFN